MTHKRYRRSYQSRWWWALLVLGIALWQWYTGGIQSTSPPEALGEGIHQVRRAVDGDTILLESGARVRLQGIDTPETVRENFPVQPWGPEASQFTKDFLRDADYRVRLTFGNERLDKYDRYLAFVWDGDRMLNEELVRAGLARARLDYRYSGRMKSRLKAAEDEARSAQRGMWSVVAERN